MKINGDLVFTEGGGIHNLTLASGTTLPETASLGELHTLYGTQGLPAGFYQHDGTDWINIPSLDAIQELIDIRLNGGNFPTFKTLFNVRTMLSARGASTMWVLNGISPIAVASGIGNMVLPVFWYDPAILPVGTKFRLSINAAVNGSNTSATTVLKVGLCKVLRPVDSGGGTSVVIYTPEFPDVINHDFVALPAKSLINVRTAEFEMPAEAGLYAFYMLLTASMNTSSTHYDLSLQAKI